MDHNFLGFCIHYFRDLANPGTKDLRIARMDESVPLEQGAHCPACSSRLSVLYTLVSGGAKRRMRCGMCEQCGYIGYMDKPSRPWLSSFYREEWDNAKVRDIEKEISLFRESSLPPVQRVIVERVCVLPIDRTKTVCDIGCGKGLALHAFSQKGFSRVVGVESSRYRSEYAKRKHRARVYQGNFEDAAQELEREAPIGIFFCFHVLEHVFDPFEFLARASKLQEPGDFFVLSVPNGEQES